jgi:hypothetical protein
MLPRPAATFVARLVEEEKESHEQRSTFPSNPNSSARLFYSSFVVQRDNDGADQTVRWAPV